MKRIIKYVAIIVLVIAAVIGLNPKASELEMVISFSVVFTIAAVFAHRMDMKERKERKEDKK